MKKKKLVIIVMMVIVLVALIVGAVLLIKNVWGKEERQEIQNANETEQETEAVISDEEFKDMEAVDSEINRLVSSSEYLKMSDDEKVKECEKLLKDLEANGKINNFSYSNSEMTYYFEYKNGVLGGIKIKDWDPDMN